MNKEDYMTACSDSTIIDAWSNGQYQKKDTSDSVGVNEHSGCQFRLYTEAEDKNKLCDIKALAVICRGEAAELGGE